MSNAEFDEFLRWRQQHKAVANRRRGKAPASTTYKKADANLDRSSSDDDNDGKNDTHHQQQLSRVKARTNVNANKRGSSTQEQDEWQQFERERQQQRKRGNASTSATSSTADHRRVRRRSKIPPSQQQLQHHQHPGDGLIDDSLSSFSSSPSPSPSQRPREFGQPCAKLPSNMPTHLTRRQRPQSDRMPATLNASGDLAPLTRLANADHVADEIEDSLSSDNDVDDIGGGQGQLTAPSAVHHRRTENDAVLRRSDTTSLAPIKRKHHASRRIDENSDTDSEGQDGHRIEPAWPDQGLGQDSNRHHEPIEDVMDDDGVNDDDIIRYSQVVEQRHHHRPDGSDDIVSTPTASNYPNPRQLSAATHAVSAASTAFRTAATTPMDSLMTSLTNEAKRRSAMMSSDPSRATGPDSVSKRRRTRRRVTQPGLAQQLERLLQAERSEFYMWQHQASRGDLEENNRIMVEVAASSTDRLSGCLMVRGRVLLGHVAENVSVICQNWTDNLIQIRRGDCLAVYPPWKELRLDVASTCPVVFALLFRKEEAPSDSLCEEAACYLAAEAYFGTVGEQQPGNGQDGAYQATAATSENRTSVFACKSPGSPSPHRPPTFLLHKSVRVSPVKQPPAYDVNSQVADRRSRDRIALKLFDGGQSALSRFSI